MSHAPSPTTQDGAAVPAQPGRVILSESDIRIALARISADIVRHNPDITKLALVGLPTRGVTLAQRIAAELQRTTQVNVPVGQIDITFHRDDLELRRPIPHVTDIPFDITDRTLILVDDVLYTGRSVRAALNALNDLGRPEAIQLATLIDRGHRRLPIAADYIGQTVATEFTDNVAVKTRENDGVDAVEVQQP